MKWNTNGTEFEGTPAEYAELQMLMRNAEKPAEEEKKQRVLLAPIHGRAVRCTGSAGYQDFINAREAWQYTVEQAGLQVSYSTFCKAAAKGMCIGSIKVEYTEPPRSGRGEACNESPLLSCLREQPQKAEA